jgi:hypothetical protein
VKWNRAPNGGGPFLLAAYDVKHAADLKAKYPLGYAIFTIAEGETVNSVMTGSPALAR